MINYTENYPEVIQIQAEIEALKEKLKDGTSGNDQMSNAETEMEMINPLYQKYKEELSNIELEIASLTVKEQHLMKLIDSRKSYLKDVPEEKKKLIDLERERNTYSKTYEELVLRLGQSEVSKQMEVQDKADTFRIVDPAITSKKPISPNRMKVGRSPWNGR